MRKSWCAFPRGAQFRARRQSAPTPPCDIGIHPTRCHCSSGYTFVFAQTLGYWQEVLDRTCTIATRAEASSLARLPRAYQTPHQKSPQTFSVFIGETALELKIARAGLVL